MQYDMFKNAPPDSPMGKVFTTLQDIPELGYLSYEEALSLMRADPKVAVYDTILPFVREKDILQIKNFQGALFPSNSFCLRKNSEFRGLINYEIMKLGQNGVHNKILGNWGIVKGAESAASASDVASAGLSYKNVVFPFLLLGGGAAAAAVLILAEHIRSCMKNLFSAG